MEVIVGWWYQSFENVCILFNKQYNAKNMFAIT